MQITGKVKRKVSPIQISNNETKKKGRKDNYYLIKTYRLLEHFIELYYSITRLGYTSNVNGPQLNEPVKKANSIM